MNIKMSLIGHQTGFQKLAFTKYTNYIFSNYIIAKNRNNSVYSLTSLIEIKSTIII